MFDVADASPWQRPVRCRRSQGQRWGFQSRGLAWVWEGRRDLSQYSDPGALSPENFRDFTLKLRSGRLKQPVHYTYLHRMHIHLSAHSTNDPEDNLGSYPVSPSPSARGFATGRSCGDFGRGIGVSRRNVIKVGSRRRQQTTISRSDRTPANCSLEHVPPAFFKPHVTSGSIIRPSPAAAAGSARAGT